MWWCPDCGRGFARRRQSHECSPAMPLEEYFATAAEWERPVFEAVLAHLETLGPIHVEPVSVGIFLKSTGSLVELRTMTRWTRLWFPLPRRELDPRIAVKPRQQGVRMYHAVDLTGDGAVDARVRDWLTEAYVAFG